MSKKSSPRALRAVLTGTVAIAVVAAMSVGTASADDTTPSDTPSASDSPSDGTSGSPSADPSETPSEDPSVTPSEEPSATPSEEPSSEPTQEGKAAVAPPPDRYQPTNNVTFNYPYSATSLKDANRTHVLRTIRSTPKGAQLRIAMFSVNDDATVDALIAAKTRGVSVQVLVNQHNARKVPGKSTSPSFMRLQRVIGTNSEPRGSLDVNEVSWAKICNASCRGYGGNVHQKMVLVSSAGGTDGKAVDHITMIGSPNLTMLAARGQWNHLNTFIDTDSANGYPMYTGYMRIFRQMALDRPITPSGNQYTYYGANQIAIQTWFYPKPGTTAGTDPLLNQMKDIRCTGTYAGYGSGGRTVIRIGQYAWFDEHGNFMARRIRQLWDQGCNISVTTAVLGNTVKSILLSPKGRGRIPVRVVGTFAKDGTTLTYNHSKYIAVNGRVGTRGDQIRVWTGTTNWTNLGYRSDEATQLYSNAQPKYAPYARSMYYAYIRNFNNIYSGPHSFAPSPASKIPGDIGEGRQQQLGAGKYARVEEN